MLDFSARTMFMSKFITLCSKECLDIKIEHELNLDEISIYPHNNPSEETYQREDLIKTAKEY